MPASGWHITTASQTRPVQTWAAKSRIGHSSATSCLKINPANLGKAWMGGRIDPYNASSLCEVIIIKRRNSMSIHLEKEKN